MRSLRPNLSFSTLISTALHSQTPAQTSARAANAPVIRSAYGEKLKLNGLPNGGKINDSLFRGAQPRAEGLKELKNLGVTTIVDLRAEDPVKISWERKEAEALGFR